MPFTDFTTLTRPTGKTWRNALDETCWTKVQLADQTANLNDTVNLIESSFLRFDLLANTWWSMESCIFYSAGTTADITMVVDMDYPVAPITAPTITMTPWNAGSSASGNFNNLQNIASNTNPWQFSSGGLGVSVITATMPNGMVMVGTDDTTLKLSFRQQTAHLTETSTLRTGSFIRLTRVV